MLPTSFAPLKRKAGDTKPYARDYIWLQQPEATFDSTAEHNLTSTTIERLKWP